jgi:hypothetical protein
MENGIFDLFYYEPSHQEREKDVKRPLYSAFMIFINTY